MLTLVEDIEDGYGEKLHKALVCIPLSPVFSRYTGGPPHFIDEPANGLDPAGMKQIRELFQMLSAEYGMTFLISSHLLSEIESIADTIGVISHGRLLKEIPMKEISEMNTAFIELTAENTQKAAYVLSDKLNLSNFKIMDDSRIRIYELSASTQKISKELLLNGVEMTSITRHTESLEDYFLKLTGEGEKSC